MDKHKLSFHNKSIGIIGYGWLGSRIAAQLSLNNTVYTTTTSEEKMVDLHIRGFNPTLVNFDNDYSSETALAWESISTIDVVIVTVPFSSRGVQYTASIESRIQHISSFLGNFKGQLFFTSSTGVYPNEPRSFKEDDLPIDNVLPEYLLRKSYPQLNILRLGGLMGDNRQLGNYEVSNLDDPVNHVHYKDVSRVIKKMIVEESYSVVYNVVAPNHPTKREVISMQKNLPFLEEEKESGRLISSERLLQELQYEFEYNDPKFFHL